jgi:competence protein ComEA
MTIKHVLLLLLTLLPLAGAAQTLVNLNTADAATLARDLEGIGESKARAIVEHRTRNGAFRSIDELALVKGIGPKTLELNRSRLRVGPAASAATGSGGAKAPARAAAPARATAKPGSSASSGAGSTAGRSR